MVLPFLCISFPIVLYIYLMNKPRPVYLLDFTCFRPPVTCRVPFSTYVEHSNLVFDSKLVLFQTRVLQKSGIGEETALPPSIHYIPPKPTMGAAREEADLIIFSVVDEIFAKTGIKAREIDFLVVKCNVFNPVPSLTSLVINRYKMKSSVKSFNLGGMGCSAELISLDLVKDMLQLSPNSYCLMVSTEIITPCLYLGQQRTMLVTNCLFRMGGAAMIVTNRASEQARAKYKLQHVVRTHLGANDKAYYCVQQKQDDEGHVGFSLSRDLPAVAGEALKANLTALGPKVLPFSEKLLFIQNFLRRRFLDPKAQPYIPNFKRSFEHFCIHAGGRAVIDDLEKNLRLSSEDVEASRMTLYRFGNTSSSSPWYSLSYTEAKGRMKRGDRVWQIALGSGFKCNSAVWKCIRTISEPAQGAWADCIDRYPLNVPDTINL
ncbi:3-ketoacyl-CoA synthase 6-like [Aristolochia californica]|uniref:3-ketoacyl-CoA synthase 6-like n=1 Tax=Aristolochia californica TaxID=171875 RepID=UPI0035E0127F